MERERIGGQEKKNEQKTRMKRMGVKRREKGIWVSM